MTKHEKQLKIEQDAHTYSYNKFLNQLSERIRMGAGHELPEGRLLITATIDTIAEKLIQYFEAPLRGDKRRDREFLVDYFDRPKDLALLLLNTIISEVSKDGKIQIITLASKINTALHKNYIMMKLKQQHPKLYSYIEREYKKRGKGYIHSRKTKLGMMKASLNEEFLSKETLRVATQLIDLVLLSGCNLLQKRVIYVKKNRQKTVLEFTDEAFQIILRNRETIALTYRKYPIFVIPPVDWSKMKGSMGYYSEDLYKGYAIKVWGSNRKLLLQFTDKKPMTRYLDVLNKIQATKWRINKRVYEVIKKVMDENIVDYESARNNPYLVGGLPYNRSQRAEDYVDARDYGDIHTEGKYEGMPKDRDAYKRWYKATEEQKETILVNRSKAISLNLAMIDAREYLDEPSIYFSYQADFRGRIYPVQQHLNPQSKGEIKALLEFGEGVPIENKYQLRWFKIHGANCYGFDKESYDTRIAEIDKLTDSIKRVASDPIRYQDEWKSCDDPYRYLAWCFEYSDYLADPIGFRSHISIGLDATCSGIQIYSGLLRDREGAEAVNVIGQTRQDIYQKVADKVNHYLNAGSYPKSIVFRKSDGTTNTSPTIAEANSLKNKVSRKLTKRNTMTQPYSVTTYGMYQQLLEELNDMESSGKKMWVGDKWVVARLLTELNDRAIVDTVEGARVGQEFLKEVSRKVTKEGRYIFYTTPIIGFPVIQKIHKVKIDRVRTELGRLSLATQTDEIHSAKMANGIAPNFIHSIDATLLILTVEKMVGCDSFHLVHDDYGVPINKVEELNTCVREAFVELFEAKPLQQFVKQVYPDMKDEAEEIMINTLDLKEVYDSEYIFS